MASRFTRTYGPLKADIEDFVKRSETAMLVVMRSSLQDIVENAQTPVAKGGRMRVDTGFLRASGRPSLNGMPHGPVRGESDKPNSYPTDEGSVNLTLAEMKLGQTFYFGWTANYARYREIYDGFLEGALQHWGRIVAFHTDDLRKRLGL